MKNKRTKLLQAKDTQERRLRNTSKFQFKRRRRINKTISELKNDADREFDLLSALEDL